MHPRQSLLEIPCPWATGIAPRAVKPHGLSALLPKPRPDSWWQPGPFHTEGRHEHHKNVCVTECFLRALMAEEYHDPTPSATCQDSEMTDQMAGFPVVNRVYARCESRGSLVQLLTVNRDLELACGPMTQDPFPQFILWDWRSLMEARLHLMAAHWQQLIFFSMALLSRLIKKTENGHRPKEKAPQLFEDSLPELKMHFSVHQHCQGVPMQPRDLSATKPGCRKHKSQFAKPLGQLSHLTFPLTRYGGRLLPNRQSSLNTFSDKYCRESVVFFRKGPYPSWKSIS